MLGLEEAELRERMRKHWRSYGLEGARPGTMCSKEKERETPREWGPGAGDWRETLKTQVRSSGG